MSKWHFSEQNLDDVDDEDTVAKNFARESRKVSAIFVREFFQNVIDASRKKSTTKPPHVTIALLDRDRGLVAGVLDPLLESVYPHLSAAEHPGEVKDSQNNVLILEEFGTSGLIGDTSNSRARGPDERWANFWFGEGKRSKTGSSLGRAGQGKITYHLVSTARTVFALTKRQIHEKELLFGKCIVSKTHEIDGIHYKRHGYWPRIGDNKQPLPEESDSEVKKFRENFSLSPRNDTGTSWIIPCVDKESFSKARLIEEFLRDFYFTVLVGELTVNIMGTSINESTLLDVLKDYPIDSLPPQFSDFLLEAITLPDNAPEFLVARDGWCVGGPEVPMPEEAFDPEDLDRARGLMRAKQLIAVKLPVHIEPKKKESVSEHIDVFLKQPEGLDQTREAYVRSGLEIGEEKYLKNAPGRYLGLVHAKRDTNISEFLGYAEVASHMRWNTNEIEATKRYTNVRSPVRSVRYSLPKLARLLSGHTSGRDYDALVDFLSVPALGKGRKRKTSKKKKKQGGGIDGGISEVPERRPRRFEVKQSEGRWKLRPGPGAVRLEYPCKIIIDLAYATMPGAGDPFKVYHRFDFDLTEKKDHPISLKNAEVVSRGLNRLEVELQSSDFSILVQGFSQHALKSRIGD